jgi:ADP-heptose:LPS heptosyltransferase
MPDRILVIKLGALGDMIQAADAFAAIRAHHAGTETVLMTAPPFAALGRAMPWFDAVWTDARPGPLRPDAWWALRRRLAGAGFARVYDLQCSRRTRRYFRLLPAGRRPEWVGDAPGCSHPNPDFSGARLSNRQKMAAQLAVAGIGPPPPADLGWLDAPIGHLALPPRYAVLIPGASPRPPGKRWPAAHYADLAQRLAAKGIPPVVVGTGADRAATDGVRAGAEVLDLVGRTSLAELASVLRGAACVVGNDTGPTFLAGALRRPTLMLISHHTDAVAAAPWGDATRRLRRHDLADLEPDEAWEALLALTAQPPT